MYHVERTAEEIEELLKACEKSGSESRYFGMTYEQGISEGIRWIIGDTEDYPLDD